jgi:cytochrome c biogenesis protein CcdA
MIELPFLTAIILGSLHAFEADHVAAVTAFAVQKPRPREAVQFGMEWALGHGGAILIAGAPLIFLGLRIPESANGTMERLVGLSLVALGAWTAWIAQRAHRRAHTDPRGAPVTIGLVHGLAGAAPAVALVPLAAMDSAAAGMGYLGLFAIGTAISMAAYACAAGYLAERANGFGERAGRFVAQFTGVGTIAIGLFWLIP